MDEFCKEGIGKCWNLHITASFALNTATFVMERGHRKEDKMGVKSYQMSLTKISDVLKAMSVIAYSRSLNSPWCSRKKEWENQTSQVPHKGSNHLHSCENGLRVILCSIVELSHSMWSFSHWNVICFWVLSSEEKQHLSPALLLKRPRHSKT